MRRRDEEIHTEGRPAVKGEETDHERERKEEEDGERERKKGKADEEDNGAEERREDKPTGRRRGVSHSQRENQTIKCVQNQNSPFLTL